MSRLERLLDAAQALAAPYHDSTFRASVMAHLDLDHREAGILWTSLHATALLRAGAEAVKDGRAPHAILPEDLILVSMMSGIHLGIAAERERWEEAQRLSSGVATEPPSTS